GDVERFVHRLRRTAEEEDEGELPLAGCSERDEEEAPPARDVRETPAPQQQGGMLQEQSSQLLDPIALSERADFFGGTAQFALAPHQFMRRQPHQFLLSPAPFDGPSLRAVTADEAAPKSHDGNLLGLQPPCSTPLKTQTQRKPCCQLLSYLPLKVIVEERLTSPIQAHCTAVQATTVSLLMHQHQLPTLLKTLHAVYLMGSAAAVEHYLGGVFHKLRKLEPALQLTPLLHASLSMSGCHEPEANHVSFRVSCDPAAHMFAEGDCVNVKYFEGVTVDATVTGPCAEVVSAATLKK
ncbi:unnamed protein product, partial [Chrysoparadoxa australica]